MEPYEGPTRIIDLIAPFGRKTPLLGKHMMNKTAVASPEGRSPISSPKQRLAANRLRPTTARICVLNALEEVAPTCLDARQMHRILSRKIDSIPSSSIYRALNDLWSAGLLVRSEGANGRAFYAIKPDASNTRYDTLRCHCGARLVFSADLVLREHLRSLARKEGFALDGESVFAITTTCAKCR